MGQVVSKRETNVNGGEESQRGTNDCVKVEVSPYGLIENQTNTNPVCDQFSAPQREKMRVKSESDSGSFGITSTSSKTSALSNSSSVCGSSGEHKYVGSGWDDAAVVSSEDGGPASTSSSVESSNVIKEDKQLIFIAPPVKWLQGIGEDSDIEEGEICSDPEVESNDSENYPAWSKIDGESHIFRQEEGGGFLKRRKLDVRNERNGWCLETCHPQLCEGGDRDRARSDGTKETLTRKRTTAHISSNLSSNSSSQSESYSRCCQISPSPSRRRRVRDDRDDDDISSQSLLLPLFRKVIDAERKKKAEVEDENKRLKSLLAKASAEKEQAFMMVQKSNSVLSKVTDNSIVLAKTVGELKAQLTERDSLINGLIKDASIISNTMLQINKTLGVLQSQGIDGTVNDNTSKTSQETEQIEEHQPLPALMELDVNGPTVRSPTDFNENPSGNSKTLTNTEASKYEKEAKQMSAGIEKSSSATSVTSCSYDEQFILSKLKDLKKWAYTIKDIKKIDGKWRCPECGDSKNTLLATAAHARDKHVWRIGSGKNKRYR